MGKKGGKDVDKRIIDPYTRRSGRFNPFTVKEDLRYSWTNHVLPSVVPSFLPGPEKSQRWYIFSPTVVPFRSSLREVFYGTKRHTIW